MKHSSLLLSIALLGTMTTIAQGATASAVQPSVSDAELLVSASNWVGRARQEDFEENKGQVVTTVGAPAPFVRYRLSQGNTSIFLLENGIAYQFSRAHYPTGYSELMACAHREPWKQQELEALRAQVRLETYRMDVILEGADPNARITTEERSKGHTNYYNHGVLDVHTFGRITYHEVYPGIDWVVYTTAQGMKYDFVVRPGADPARIQLRFKDHEELYVDAAGHLIHGNRMGRFTEEAPVSFLQAPSAAAAEAMRPVRSHFVLEKDLLCFAVEAYDRNQILTIDPSRLWGTYYGGSDLDIGYSCAVAGDGSVYLAGSTSSTGVIAENGSQNSYGGQGDAFLVKFNANGVRAWGSYYGGSGADWASSCAVNEGGVYLVGTTTSTSGIHWAPGFQDAIGGDYDAFLVKFNADGLRVWGTYYGGLGGDYGESCALGMDGAVYLAGYTGSSSGIAVNGHQNTLGGLGDAFLVRFDTNCNRAWGTYYGGSGDDHSESCAVGADGNVHLAGWTESTNNIAQGGQQNTYGGGQYDAYLSKFDGNGNLLWGTYYGGGDADWGNSCAVAVDGSVYLGGPTYSTTGIAENGHQNDYGGGG